VTDALIVLRMALVRLGFMLGSRRPLERRVVLATGSARALGGNLEAIRAEIARRSPTIAVSILAHRPAGALAGRFSAAIHAVIAGYRLATSRLFVVDDYFFPIYAITPRHGTMIVQTWHASGAFKKMGYSLAGKTFGADAALLRRVRIHANYDLCLVSAARLAPHYAEAFRQPLHRFSSSIGVPRADPLLDAAWCERSADAIRRRYKIPPGHRVLLFAPTFRGERTTNARHTDDLDLQRLQEVLGRDHVVLVRLHPFIRSRLKLDPDLAGFAIDVSDHDDIGELMATSDVLVTDYSSTIYEYSLLERPIAFFAPDHAAYERERGFYLDYARDLPGPIFETTEPLAAYLRAGEFDTELVARFRDASFDVTDGRASARFVDDVVLPAVGGVR